MRSRGSRVVTNGCTRSFRLVPLTRHGKDVTLLKVLLNFLERVTLCLGKEKNDQDYCHYHDDGKHPKGSGGIFSVVVKGRRDDGSECPINKSGNASSQRTDAVWHQLGHGRPWNGPPG